MEYATSKKILSLVVVLAVVVGVVYLLTVDQPGGQDENKNIASVKHVDLDNAASAQDKKPSGMPSDIPVETDVVVESYSAVYKDPAVTQYAMTFKSTATMEQKYNMYKQYMTEGGYEITEGDADQPIRYLKGVKEGDELSVVIGQSGQDTQVQLSYLDRE